MPNNIPLCRVVVSIAYEALKCIGDSPSQLCFMMCAWNQKHMMWSWSTFLDDKVGTHQRGLLDARQCSKNRAVEDAWDHIFWQNFEYHIYFADCSKRQFSNVVNCVCSCYVGGHLSKWNPIEQFVWLCASNVHSHISCVSPVHCWSADIKTCSGLSNIFLESGRSEHHTEAVTLSPKWKLKLFSRLGFLASTAWWTTVHLDFQVVSCVQLWVSACLVVRRWCAMIWNQLKQEGCRWGDHSWTVVCRISGWERPVSDLFLDREFSEPCVLHVGVGAWADVWADVEAYVVGWMQQMSLQMWWADVVADVVELLSKLMTVERSSCQHVVEQMWWADVEAAVAECRSRCSGWADEQLFVVVVEQSWKQRWLRGSWRGWTDEISDYFLFFCLGFIGSFIARCVILKGMYISVSVWCHLIWGFGCIWIEMLAAFGLMVAFGLRLWWIWIERLIAIEMLVAFGLRCCCTWIDGCIWIERGCIWMEMLVPFELRCWLRLDWDVDMLVAFWLRCWVHLEWEVGCIWIMKFFAFGLKCYLHLDWYVAFGLRCRLHLDWDMGCIWIEMLVAFWLRGCSRSASSTYVVAVVLRRSFLHERSASVGPVADLRQHHSFSGAGQEPSSAGLVDGPAAAIPR